MSAISTPPPIAYSSGDHEPPGKLFLTPIGVAVTAASITVPPGTYLISATAEITGGASESLIAVDVVDSVFLGGVISGQQDVPAGFLSLVTLSPRRLVCTQTTTLLLRGTNNTIATSQISTAGSNCYLTAQLCT